MTTYGAILSLALLVGTNVSSAQDAIVKIYAVGRAGAGQGTGFFASEKGEIVTAYHVIQGARRIEVVHDRLGTFADIEIAFISPEYDLAILQIANPPTNLPHLRLAPDAMPRLADDYATDGYPRGGEQQHFRMRATRDGFTASNSVRDARGNRLFSRSIDVVALDMTAYSGMSGAPVIGFAGVIGVFSGSYDEGGGFAWAIPAKYLGELQAIGRKADEVGDWPALSLMSGAWKTLRSALQVNTNADAIYQTYVDQVGVLAACYTELHATSASLLPHIEVLRPFLQRVITDPSLASDAEAARTFLEQPESIVRDEFRRGADLMEACPAEKNKLAVALAGLVAWLADESNISERQGKDVVKKLGVVRGAYADINSVDLAEYLKIDMDRSLEFLTRHAEDARSTVPSTRARSLQAFLDAFVPTYQAIASFRAITYTTREISKFRRIAQVFEPLVYLSTSNR